MGIEEAGEEEGTGGVGGGLGENESSQDEK